MTSIEIQTMEAVKQASRAVYRELQDTEKRYEQRYYETARDILASMAGAQWNVDEDVLVKKSMRLARKLLMELQGISI